MTNRRKVLAGLGAVGLAGLGALGGLALQRFAGGRPPNIVLILTDDQGYNDLGCYYTAGPVPRVRTPRLDAMAEEGVRLTSFYVAASVCTPSRASILTGCYPPRVGFAEKEEGPGVLTPRSRAGLNPEEQILPELLGQVGYQTACVGKWHLGHLPGFLPHHQGFQDFFGIPYSNNQRPLPLMRNDRIVRMLPDEPVLVGAFTQAALTFLNTARPPFFLYLAHSAPHWPFGVPQDWQGRSARGPYGDVVEQIDWSVGEVLDALERRGLAEDTLVIFLSDNGPWLDERVQAGSAHPLRGGKASSFEGGFRSPFIARWPGVLPAGAEHDQVVTALDLLPTLVDLAGASRPALPIDGHDVWPLLAGRPDASSPTEVFYYYARGRLEAVRSGRYKLVFANALRRPPVERALYDLIADVGETTDVAAQHPEQVARLEALAERMRAELGDGLTGQQGSARRPIGRA